MEWLKRNMMLAIGGAVALLLVLAAGYYLFSRLQAEKEKDTAVADLKTRLENLYNQSPYPNSENTEAVIKAEEQVKSALKEVGRYYPLQDAESTNLITNAELKLKMIAMTAELRDQAQRASITLPTNFAFSFSKQMQVMRVDTNGLDLVYRQLQDVQALSEIVFKAQIPELLMLRRSTVTKDDREAMAVFPRDYLANRSLQTNDWSIRYPYELTFKGLTDELKTVLEGLAHSPHGFVVRYVKVEPLKTAEQGELGDGSGLSERYGVDYAARYGLARRYGMDRRYGQPQAAEGPPPPPKPTVGVVVDKQPLKITLMVEAVRPLPPGSKPPAAPPADGSVSPDGTATPADAAAPAPASTPPAAASEE